MATLSDYWHANYADDSSVKRVDQSISVYPGVKNAGCRTSTATSVLLGGRMDLLERYNDMVCLYITKFVMLASFLKRYLQVNMCIVLAKAR